MKRGLGLNEFNADQWLDPKNKRAQSVDFIAFAMASGVLNGLSDSVIVSFFGTWG